MKKIFNKFINKQKENLKKPLFIFKIFATFIVIDFIAFLSLGSINPLQLLNPVKFLFSADIDNRISLKLYYPENKIIDSILNKESKEEKRKYNIIEVKQSVFQYANDSKISKQHLLEKNIQYILQDLFLGPGYEKMNIKVKRFILNEDLIKKVWVINNKAILHFNKKKLMKYSKNKKEVLKKCIQKSILTNLSDIKKIQWVL